MRFGHRSHPEIAEPALRSARVEVVGQVEINIDESAEELARNRRAYLEGELVEQNRLEAGIRQGIGADRGGINDERPRCRWRQNRTAGICGQVNGRKELVRALNGDGKGVQESVGHERFVGRKSKVELQSWLDQSRINEQRTHLRHQGLATARVEHRPHALGRDEVRRDEKGEHACSTSKIR